MDYFQSESKTIRNYAYLAAMSANLNGSCEFLFEELLNLESELIKGNLALLFKIKPQLWDVFIKKLKKTEKIPVNVIVELAGIVTFYRGEGNDYIWAEQLVQDYKTKGDEANELFLGLLVCLQNNERLFAKIEKLSNEINSKIENGLLKYMDNSCLLYGKNLDAIELIAAQVDYALKEKIVQKLLSKHCHNYKMVSLAYKIVEKNQKGLRTFMPALLEYLNNKEVNREQRFNIGEMILALLLDKDIKISSYQGRCFFASLAEWLAADWFGRKARVDFYLETHPKDVLKVFRLYDQAFVLVSRKYGVEIKSIEWFKGQNLSDNINLLVMVAAIFKKDLFLGVRRYGSYEEKTKAYLLALYGMLVTQNDIRKEAADILNLLMASPKLVGSVNEILPDLEWILEHSRRLRPDVNYLLDVILSSKDPLNSAQVLDISKLYNFCKKYELQVDVFKKMYGQEIAYIVEKKHKEVKDLELLQQIFDAQ